MKTMAENSKGIVDKALLTKEFSLNWIALELREGDLSLIKSISKIR